MNRTAALLAAAFPAVARAGMPEPYAAFREISRATRLTESAEARVQAISFFVVVLLACAVATRWLWNVVARDLGLPPVRFRAALAGVVLWGVVFVLILTMISGARELMTPGAWKPAGVTSTLAAAPAVADPTPAVARRQQLERVRQALWHFAATHDGRFPTAAELTALPADLLDVPDSAGLRFAYVAGLRAGDPAADLVIGPPLDGRLTLRTDGTIAEELP